MTRSVWKGPYTKNSIFKEIFENKQKGTSKHKIIVLDSKNSVIFPLFVGLVFSLYNGQKYVNVQVNKDMVGYKFGEFVTTRKKAMHNKK